MSFSLIFSSIDIYITISNFDLFALNKPLNRLKHKNSHISKLWFCSYCFFEKLSRGTRGKKDLYCVPQSKRFWRSCYSQVIKTMSSLGPRMFWACKPHNSYIHSYFSYFTRHFEVTQKKLLRQLQIVYVECNFAVSNLA